MADSSQRKSVPADYRSFQTTLEHLFQETEKHLHLDAAHHPNERRARGAPATAPMRATAERRRETADVQPTPAPSSLFIEYPFDDGLEGGLTEDLSLEKASEGPPAVPKYAFGSANSATRPTNGGSSSGMNSARRRAPSTSGRPSSTTSSLYGDAYEYSQPVQVPLMPSMQAVHAYHHPPSHADLDLLQRVEHLRIGVEQFRHSNEQNIRGLDRKTRGQMHALVTRLNSQLSELETRLNANYSTSHQTALNHTLEFRRKVKRDLREFKGEMDLWCKNETARMMEMERKVNAKDLMTTMGFAQQMAQGHPYPTLLPVSPHAIGSATGGSLPIETIRLQQQLMVDRQEILSLKLSLEQSLLAEAASKRAMREEMQELREEVRRLQATTSLKLASPARAAVASAASPSSLSPSRSHPASSSSSSFDGPPTRAEFDHLQSLVHQLESSFQHHQGDFQELHRAAERSFEQQLASLKEVVAGHSTAVRPVSSETTSDLAPRVSSLAESLTHQATTVDALVQGVRGLEERLGSVAEQVEGATREIQGVGLEVHDIRQDVDDLKEQQSTMDTELRQVSTQVDTHHAQLGRGAEYMATLREDVKHVKSLTSPMPTPKGSPGETTPVKAAAPQQSTPDGDEVALVHARIDLLESKVTSTYADFGRQVSTQQESLHELIGHLKESASEQAAFRAEITTRQDDFREMLHEELAATVEQMGAIERRLDEMQDQVGAPDQVEQQRQEHASLQLEMKAVQRLLATLQSQSASSIAGTPMHAASSSEFDFSIRDQLASLTHKVDTIASVFQEYEAYTSGELQKHDGWLLQHEAIVRGGAQGAGAQQMDDDDVSEEDPLDAVSMEFPSRATSITVTAAAGGAASTPSQNQLSHLAVTIPQTRPGSAQAPISTKSVHPSVPDFASILAARLASPANSLGHSTVSLANFDASFEGSADDVTFSKRLMTDHANATKGDQQQRREQEMQAELKREERSPIKDDEPIAPAVGGGGARVPPLNFNPLAMTKKVAAADPMRDNPFQSPKAAPAPAPTAPAAAVVPPPKKKHTGIYTFGKSSPEASMADVGREQEEEGAEEDQQEEQDDASADDIDANDHAAGDVGGPELIASDPEDSYDPDFESASPSPLPEAEVDPSQIATEPPTPIAPPTPRAFHPSETRHCNTQEDFRRLRKEIRQYGVDRLLHDQLAAGWFARNPSTDRIEVSTAEKPFNPFSRLVTGQLQVAYAPILPAHDMAAEAEDFFLAKNRPELDAQWASDEKEWVGKASMSARHQFLLIKSLDALTFNVATFGMRDEGPRAGDDADEEEAVRHEQDKEALIGALHLLNALESAALTYTARAAGWSSEEVGLFFHAFPFNSVHALHLHVVDLSQTGPTFDALAYKNLPLSCVREVLLEELETFSPDAVEAFREEMADEAAARTSRKEMEAEEAARVERKEIDAEAKSTPTKQSPNKKEEEEAEEVVEEEIIEEDISDETPEEATTAATVAAGAEEDQHGTPTSMLAPARVPSSSSAPSSLVVVSFDPTSPASQQAKAIRAQLRKELENKQLVLTISCSELPFANTAVLVNECTTGASSAGDATAQWARRGWTEVKKRTKEPHYETGVSVTLLPSTSNSSGAPLQELRFDLFAVDAGTPARLMASVHAHLEELALQAGEEISFPWAGLLDQPALGQTPTLTVKASLADRMTKEAVLATPKHGLSGVNSPNTASTPVGVDKVSFLEPLPAVATPAAAPATVASSSPAGPSPSPTVLLLVRLTNLPLTSAGHNKPLVALFCQDTVLSPTAVPRDDNQPPTRFVFASQTEWLADVEDAEFQQGLVFPYTPGHILKLNVYDALTPDISDSERLGSVFVRQDDLYESACEAAADARAGDEEETVRELTFYLNHEDPIKNERLGQIELIIEAQLQEGDELDEDAHGHADADDGDEAAIPMGVQADVAPVQSPSLAASEAKPLSPAAAAPPASPPDSHESVPRGGAVDRHASSDLQAFDVSGDVSGSTVEHTVRISIACKGLPITKASGTCDPIVAAFMQESATGEFSYIAQTEWQRSTCDPEFADQIELMHRPMRNQLVKLSIYDVSSESVSDDERIGSVLVQMDDIFLSVGLSESGLQADGTLSAADTEQALIDGLSNEMHFLLLHDNDQKNAALKGATICVRYEWTSLQPTAGSHTSSTSSLHTPAVDRSDDIRSALDSHRSGSGQSGSASQSEQDTTAEDDEEDADRRRTRSSALGGGLLRQHHHHNLELSGQARTSHSSAKSTPKSGVASPRTNIDAMLSDIANERFSASDEEDDQHDDDDYEDDERTDSPRGQPATSALAATPLQATPQDDEYEIEEELEIDAGDQE